MPRMAKKTGMNSGTLWIIAILLLAIVLTAISFSEYSRSAFWLMLPYLIWVAYASYLNLGIWRLNRGAA